MCLVVVVEPPQKKRTLRKSMMIKPDYVVHYVLDPSLLHVEALLSGKALPFL